MSTPAHCYVDATNAYEAGRDGGPPPSERFDVLEAPREDLLSRTVLLHLRTLQEQTFEPYRELWARLERELELSACESAYLLGLVHDASPEWAHLLPWEPPQ